MPGKRPNEPCGPSSSRSKDSFLVSISAVSDKIELVAEKTAENLGLAEAMIEQTAAELRHRMNDVDLVYNLFGAILAMIPKSRLRH